MEPSEGWSRELLMSLDPARPGSSVLPPSHAATPAMRSARSGRVRGQQRGLTTMLFTDIVESSEVAVELGGRGWRHLQSLHHSAVRRQLRRHDGRGVDTAGDGFFATFAASAEGVPCAFAIGREVRELGLDVRAGLHIGEGRVRCLCERFSHQFLGQSAVAHVRQNGSQATVPGARVEIREVQMSDLHTPLSIGGHFPLQGRLNGIAPICRKVRVKVGRSDASRAGCTLSPSGPPAQHPQVRDR
jgi:hypothetical protein